MSSHHPVHDHCFHGYFEAACVLQGDIYLKNGANLDRETLTTYTFQVTAYDSPLDATVRLNTTAPVGDHWP